MSENGQLPEHLSASSITTFQQCPLKFKLSRVDGHTEPPTIHTLLGNFVHEVLEEMYRRHDGDDRNISNAKSLCTEMWSKNNWEERVSPYLGDTTLNQFRWSAWWCVENLFSMENPPTIVPSGVEHELYNEIDGVLVKGYIDRWEKIDLASAKITDYKTGKTPNPRYAKDKFFQLTLYAAMLQLETGISEYELELLYLKDGARLTHKPTKAEIEAVKETVVSIRKEIETCHENNDWKPQPTPLCNWCIFKRGLCSYWN